MKFVEFLLLDNSYEVEFLLLDNSYEVESLLLDNSYEVLSHVDPLSCLILLCNCYHSLGQLQSSAAMNLCLKQHFEKNSFCSYLLSTSKEVSWQWQCRGSCSSKEKVG